MNISGIGSTSPLTASTSIASNSNSAPSVGSSSATGEAASAKISSPGQLMGRLQQLAEQDPAKFKQATADIAAQLRQTAQSATGPGAEIASNLADRFDAASKSGDLSSLAPQHGAGGAEGHHHHHHGGGGGGGGGIASVLSNALDEVNQVLASSTSADAASDATQV